MSKRISLSYCYTELLNIEYSLLLLAILSENFEYPNSTTNIISSRAYQMCFCETNKIYDCSGSVLKLEVHRGQTFRVPLLALNQIRVVSSMTVTVKISASSSVRYYQNFQALPNICSNLTYNVYSTESIEELVLVRVVPPHPNKGQTLRRLTIELSHLTLPISLTIFIVVPTCCTLPISLALNHIHSHMHPLTLYHKSSTYKSCKLYT